MIKAKVSHATIKYLKANAFATVMLYIVSNRLNANAAREALGLLRLHSGLV
jgi:hypothetical protein